MIFLFLNKTYVCTYQILRRYVFFISKKKRRDKNPFDPVIFYIRIRHLTRPNKTIDVIYFKNQVRKYLKSTQYLTTTTTKEVCDVNRYF